MRNYFFTLLLGLPVLLNSCASDSLSNIDDTDAQYDYVFYLKEPEASLWKADFADLPVGSEDAYELSYGPAELPKETGQEKAAYKLSGHNYSDDLFMFAARKLDGLQPNTTYSLHFNVELASNAPRNSIGIGGSPGASVYLKAGAIPTPPEREARQLNGTSYWQVNFDKGNQSEEGSDMQLLGHTGTDRGDFTYTLIERSSSKPFIVTSNDTGELWLLLGFDSGFEGKTTLYFTRLRLKLSQTETADSKSISLIP
jgi:hypothetical protein